MWNTSGGIERGTPLCMSLGHTVSSINSNTVSAWSSAEILELSESFNLTASQPIIKMCQWEHDNANGAFKFTKMETNSKLHFVRTAIT